MVGGDDQLVDMLVARADGLAGIPAAQLVRDLRPIVTEVMLAVRADGSWFDTEVVQESLAIVIDVVDAVIAEQGMLLEEMDADERRWLDACRASSSSLRLLDDMLDDLRRSLRPPGPNAGETW